MNQENPALSGTWLCPGPARIHRYPHICTNTKYKFFSAELTWEDTHVSAKVMPHHCSTLVLSTILYVANFCQQELQPLNLSISTVVITHSNSLTLCILSICNCEPCQKWLEKFHSILPQVPKIGTLEVC